MSNGMTGIPLAAQAAAAAAAEAAIEAALHPLGRPRPGVESGLGGVVVMIVFDIWWLEAVAVEASAGDWRIADEIEPKLVSDEEIGDRWSATTEEVAVVIVDFSSTFFSKYIWGEWGGETWVCGYALDDTESTSLS